MRILQYLLIAASLGFLCCSIPDDPSQRKAIAVGERTVTLGELERDMKYIASGTGTDPEAVIERMIDHYLILEYGREEGIEITEKELDQFIGEIKADYEEKDFRDVLLKQYMDFERWREAVRQQLLVNKVLTRISAEIPPVSYEEIRAYYERHREEFKRPVRVKLRQIVTKDREEAEEIRQWVYEGEDMGELARKFSIAPEAQDDGMIGWVDEEGLEEAMSKAVSSLKVGQISPVVGASYGYHVLQVLERRDAGYRDLPDAAGEIESKLFSLKEEQFFGEWLKGLRERFPVWADRDLIANMLEPE